MQVLLTYFSRCAVSGGGGEKMLSYSYYDNGMFMNNFYSPGLEQKLQAHSMYFINTHHSNCVTVFVDLSWYKANYF